MPVPPAHGQFPKRGGGREEIKKQLEAAGFGVVHDTTCHDYPSYNGSYDRSGETIQRNLEKYPDIQVTLDVHRDAMGTQDGMRIKETALINGKKKPPRS